MFITCKKRRLDGSYTGFLPFCGDPGFHTVVKNKQAVVNDAFNVQPVAQIHRLKAFSRFAFTAQSINFHLYFSVSFCYTVLGFISRDFYKEDLIWLTKFRMLASVVALANLNARLEQSVKATASMLLMRTAANSIFLDLFKGLNVELLPINIVGIIPSYLFVNVLNVVGAIDFLIEIGRASCRERV